MALIFCDGFDYYAASQATVRGYSANFSSMDTGRVGGQSARLVNASGLVWPGYTLPSTYRDLIVGFAFKVDTFSGWSFSTNDMFNLKTSGGTILMRIRPTNGALLQVINSAGSVTATGTTVLTAATWYFVEFKIHVDATTAANGTIEVRLNGATEIASQNANFGTTAIGAFDLATQQANSATPIDFDDLRICDTSGSKNNAFMGDRRIGALVPTADGAHSAFTAIQTPTLRNLTALQGNALTASSQNVTLPSYKVGDVIFVHIASTGNNAVSGPAGWTKVGTDTQIGTTSKSVRLFMRQMDSTDVANNVTSATFTAAGAQTWEVRALSYYMASGTLELSIDIVSNTATATYNSSALTTTDARCTILSFFTTTRNSSNQFSVSNAGTVERYDDQFINFGAGGMAMEEIPAATAGTYTVNGTDSASTDGVLMTVVLKPPTTHWTAVFDPTPDGDSGYLSDATAGDLETFAFSDISSGSIAVDAVVVRSYARMDDAGPRQFAPVIRQAGTDYVGTTQNLTTSYKYYEQIYENDPTGSAWTASNVNADEFGVKEIT